MNPNGKPQLMAEKCPTCVFRPGNLMHLEPGRLADLIARNQAAGCALICHATLKYGQYPEVGQSVCRGYYDAYPDTAVLQVVERLGGFCLVTLPDGGAVMGQHFSWSRPQDYSGHGAPVHGTYDGYVRGCRKPCCNCPDNRELFAKNYPHGIPKQNKKAIPTDERTSNDDTDPTDDTTD